MSGSERRRPWGARGLRPAGRSRRRTDGLDGRCWGWFGRLGERGPTGVRGERSGRVGQPGLVGRGVGAVARVSGGWSA